MASTAGMGMRPFKQEDIQMSNIDAPINMTTPSLGMERRGRRFSGRTENRAADYKA